MKHFFCDRQLTAAMGHPKGKPAAFGPCKVALGNFDQKTSLLS